MAKKVAEPPKTLIAFEFAGRFTTNLAGERVELVTVTARRGDVGYVADVEMQSIEADLLPVIRCVHAVFFEAETEGLPSFPDIEKETAIATPSPAEEEQAYTISFYGGSDGESDEAGEGAEDANGYVEQFNQADEGDRSDDYYAELADEYEVERGEGE